MISFTICSPTSACNYIRSIACLVKNANSKLLYVIFSWLREGFRLCQTICKPMWSLQIVPHGRSPAVVRRGRRFWLPLQGCIAVLRPIEEKYPKGCRLTRRSKVRFAPTFFYSCGTKERHPPAPLLLLSKSQPLRWVVIWVKKRKYPKGCRLTHRSKVRPVIRLHCSITGKTVSLEIFHSNLGECFWRV